MAIRIGVIKKEQRLVAELGAVLQEDGRTWVIPDEVTDINPFKDWLPQTDVHIVQRPYFAVRAKCHCWKCGGETPVVGLGAKNYQYLFFETVDKPLWEREDVPILFTEIHKMDKEIAATMQANYPFFQLTYSKFFRRKLWANCCTHCGALQEDNGDYMYGNANPFSPFEIEQAKEIRVIYFKLKFDYCIDSGYGFNPLFETIIH